MPASDVVPAFIQTDGSPITFNTTFAVTFTTASKTLNSIQIDLSSVGGQFVNTNGFSIGQDSATLGAAISSAVLNPTNTILTVSFTGFVPGGGSLHNTFASHGPDADTYAKASSAELKPQKLDGTLAFMFESRWTIVPTKQAMEATFRQRDYDAVWSGLTRKFR